VGAVCDSPIDRQFVPTVETIPALFLARLFVTAHTRTLLVGPETSETLMFHMLGDDVMDPSVFVALSQCSQPRDLSGTFLSVTNHPHGHVAPLLGRLLLLFFDNLGAAQREKYSGQPVLELM
jgi:hypothetical protein